MNDRELLQISERCHKAPKGPWMVSLNEDYTIEIRCHVETTVTISEKFYPSEVAQRPSEFVTDDYGYVVLKREFQPDLLDSTMDTLDFVAHSRTDIPKLIAEIKRLRELLTE